jgi:hypothetical protein
VKVGEAASRVGKHVYHTGSRERGGGLRQTLCRQVPQRERFAVGRADGTGTVGATPLGQRLPTLARALAALEGPNGARRVSVAATQATCRRGA